MKRPPRRDVSLARALSKLGYTSRSRAEELIRDGHVRVNGHRVRLPSFRCSPGHDEISVDGKPVEKKLLTYIIMHKPTGFVTTRSDERGRKTVYDILGEIRTWVFPVGRLDKDTSGLLILTNDNQFGERMTNPGSKVPKQYRVQLNKALASGHAQTMRSGMQIDGGKLLPAGIKIKENGMIEMTIHEGKNRQIRRMCESLGYEVLSLVRTGIGKFQLGGLKPGEWRHLSPKDLELLETSSDG